MFSRWLRATVNKQQLSPISYWQSAFIQISFFDNGRKRVPKNIGECAKLAKIFQIANRTYTFLVLAFSFGAHTSWQQFHGELFLLFASAILQRGIHLNKTAIYLHTLRAMLIWCRDYLHLFLLSRLVKPRFANNLTITTSRSPKKIPYCVILKLCESSYLK